MSRRVICLFFAFSLAIGILITQMAIIISGGADAASFTRNTISAVIASSRGYIYDCNMNPLVNTQSELYVAVKPDIQSLGEAGSVVLEDEKEKLFNSVSEGSIGVARATAVTQSNNIKVVPVVERYCDDGLAVHIVGYTDYDGNGVCGIEKYYNEILNSAKGTLKAKCSVDALGHILEGSPMMTEGDGYNNKKGVQLTIDSSVQQICENALSKFQIEKGAVVVLDVETSEIRAMASAPEFDQNNPAKSLNDENAPFLNRAITPYSVGSVFKAVVAAAALEKGISTDTQYTCNAAITLGTNTFGCHNKNGHGTLNMYSAMAQSCNPYFINLAIMAGKQSICDMGTKLGLGAKTELADGFYSAGGIMPEQQDIVSEQDLANLAFGQGELLASPLQMAAVYAAIANNGVYRAPSLMKAVIDENMDMVMAAELPAPRRAMEKETAITIQKLLYETVENGSGAKAKPNNATAAGKTATAQSGQFNSSQEEITQSWFCGYFPYDEPHYAVTVLKENGLGGSADCAPVFKYIAESIVETQNAEK